MSCTCCGQPLDPAVTGAHPSCQPGHALNAEHLTTVLRLLAGRLGAEPLGGAR